MPDWQYERVIELFGLQSGGVPPPFYRQLIADFRVNRAIDDARREARLAGRPPEEVDVAYTAYLAWIDQVNSLPPRIWEGHLTAANTITTWYRFRDAMPAPLQYHILRSWNAWLMPDRETELDYHARRDFNNVSGRLVHSMVDDPRVGVSNGVEAVWDQGDTYHRLTGDWRGNKSYYRSGFTRDISTQNFNFSAVSGALLIGQIIDGQTIDGRVVDARHAIGDGRAGLATFPFWLWTWNAGVGQEYIDHFYWAITVAAGKMFPDFAENAEDRMMGRSILYKTANDLSVGYHPNLKRLIGSSNRTFFEHLLGKQDGLYHIIHVLSPEGALTDMETGVLTALGNPIPNAQGRPRPPPSAWGHDYHPTQVA
jgi:hypothetical protein